MLLSWDPVYSANGIISDSASYPIFVLGDTLYRKPCHLVKPGFVQRFLYISTVAYISVS